MLFIDDSSGCNSEGSANEISKLEADNAECNCWAIEENCFNPEHSGHYETIFTLTNGYMGIRGASDCSSAVFRRGTFISGIYDKGEAQVTEIVNCPSFLNFDLNINGERLDFAKCDILCYNRRLNIKKALLQLNACVSDSFGRVLNIKSTKMVSTADKRIAVLSVDITPLNFTGSIRFTSEVDATASNYDKSSEREIRHYDVISDYCSDDGAAVLSIETKDSGTKVNIAVCSGLRYVTCNGLRADRSPAVGSQKDGASADRSPAVGSQEDGASEGGLNGKMTALCQSYSRQGDRMVSELKFEAVQGVTYTIDRVACITHSLDCPGNCTPESTAEYAYAAFIKGADELLRQHIAVMNEKWGIADIIIEGDAGAQLAIRYNILNLLMLGANADGNSSIGAKGLHGEGYKGHVFWDTEIFILPFYIYTQPSTAQKLLLYRYNRLRPAREYAKSGGFKGARFPWESADTGEEVTPEYFYPKEGGPIKCHTGDEEIHITADVAFSFYEYYRITGDSEFYLKYCAEVLLETAAFWVSRLEYNDIDGFYEIHSVIGPDEYHIHVNNDCYINYLARWNILKAVETWEDIKKNYAVYFDDICARTGIYEKSINEWKDIVPKIVQKISDSVFEQFDGYFSLKDYEINEYDEKGMPVLPSYFKGEKDFWGYRLIKQADVVMLLHLFSDQFSDCIKKLNYEYYKKRTVHLSSLSPSIYSLVGANLKLASKVYEYFNASARTDIEDNQGNTDDGIHAAAVGGTWQAAVLGFGGLRIKNGIAGFDPWLPEKWKSLSYKVMWKNEIISCHITKKYLKVMITGSDNVSYKISICGQIHTINANSELMRFFENTEG